MVAQQTRGYELVMILNPESTEDETAAIVEDVKGIIVESGGSVTNHDILGLRRLPFPVMKVREGNFALINFVSDPSMIANLNKSLVSSEEILRFLLTKVSVADDNLACIKSNGKSVDEIL